MKRGFKSYLVLAVLGIAIPFFIGINCCCWAKEEKPPAKSCHVPASHTPTENSTNSCKCTHHFISAAKDQSTLFQFLASSVKKISPMAGPAFLFSSAEIFVLEEVTFFDKTDSPPNKIYLSFIHAHAPPLC